MLPIIQVILNNVSKILNFTIEIYKKYPWLFIVTILIFFILYQKYQIRILNNNLSSVENKLNGITIESKNLYSVYVKEKDNYDDLFKKLKQTVKQNDEFNKQIKSLSLLIKQRNEKPTEVITIKTDSITYKDSILVAAKEEKIEGKLKISFYRDLPTVKIYGYVITPPALSYFEVVEKPRIFRMVKTSTSEGLDRFYIVGNPEFGVIQELEVSSLPSEKPQTIWNKAKIKPTAYFTYKIPLETFETVVGLNIWKIMPVAGIELRNKDRISWFYGIRFTLY